MKATNLTSISKNVFLDIVPTTNIEAIIGSPMKWTVTTSRQDIMAWNLTYYNTCIVVDAHRRFRNVPLAKHPLNGIIDNIHTDTEFVERVQAEHNQALGSPRGCRRLHKLRGWGHGKTEQVSARGTRAGCAARS